MTTSLVVAFCGAAGYGLDALFATGSLFFIIGLVLAFPASHVAVMIVMKRHLSTYSS